MIKRYFLFHKIFKQLKEDFYIIYFQPTFSLITFSLNNRKAQLKLYSQ